MFLKRLTLFGFKSFAEKTVFEFEGGIGGLVGPNGCGKSNVMDAFRWVLGETSMSTLRAKKYDDVIFNGTEKRKKLGYCEVTILFDNSTRHFNMYDTDEIAVKRRLYRDGDSQYFINKQRCNLKDVRELFMDTGLGKSAYSIIGQGEIEKIISTKPEKRREIFEEAAGIAKYKSKIGDAQKRLEKTEENILRINDIIFEVEKNLENLKVQAEKAKEYKDLRASLREADIQLGLFKIHGLDSQREKLDRRAERLNHRKDEIRLEIDKFYQSAEAKLKLIQEKENEQKNYQSQANNLDVEIRTSEHKIVILREQHHSYEKQILADKSKEGNLHDRLREIDKYINLRREEAETIESRIEDYKANLAELNEESRQIELTLREHGVELTRLKNQNEELRDEVVRKRKDQRKAIDELVMQIDEKKKEYAKDYEARHDIKNEILTTLSRIEKGLKEKRDILDEVIKSGAYKDSAKLAELKESFFQILFEMETCIGYSDKLKGHFEKLSAINDGISSLIFDKKGVHAKKSNIDDDINRIENNIRDNIKKITSIEEDIDRKRESREKIYRMINDIQVTLASLNEKKNAYSEEARRTVEQKGEFELALVEIRESILKNEDKLISIENEVHATLDKYEVNKAKQKELDDMMHMLSTQIIELTKDVQKIEEDQRKMLDEERMINGELESLHLRYQEIDLKKKSIVENFYENYSVNIEDFQFKETEFDPEELEKTKKRVRTKLAAIGDNVNLLAIEEYEEMRERYNFLKNQKQDLEDAKKDLLNIIKEIYDISKAMFEETMEKVKVNFTKLFKRLFNGGKANIVLLDPTNILETGIEIEVQPPEKKLQSLSLLSGGEKSMTAIALMFSILMVRPSPFVLLDEIDAALDDINISRFVTLVKEFVGNTQFLVITHNPLTIQTCHFLYGITMEEPGITKVFSIKSENNEKVPAN